MNKSYNLSHKLLVICLGLLFSFAAFDMVNNSLVNQTSKIFTILVGILYTFEIFYYKSIFINNFKENKEIKYTVLLFLCILLLLNFYTIITLGFFTFNEFIACLQLLIICIIAFTIKISRNDLIMISAIWIGFGFLFSILLILANIGNTNRALFLFLDGSIDPNLFSASIISPLLLSIYGIKFKNHKIKFFCIISLLVMVLSLFLCGSRGVLLALVVGLSLFILLRFKYIYYKVKLTKKNIFILILFILVIILIILFLVPKETLERLNPISLIQDSGSGRFQIWLNAISFFNKSEVINKIIGYGTGAFKYTAGAAIEMYGGTVYINMASHNIYIRLLIETGILGVVCLTIIYYKILSISKNKKNYFIFIFIIILILVGMTLDLTLTRFYWYGIIFSILSINSALFIDNNL